MSRASKNGKGPKGGRGAKAAREAGPQPFGTLETGRLTWLGLAVALIGWLMLIAVAALSDGPHAPRSPQFRGDLMTIAQTLIGSGFALAAIGTLQAGFGALDRFFNAALHRSGARAAARPTGPVEAAGTDDDDAESGQAYGPVVEAAPRRPRPYRTFPDGSVEVETILGTRRFATMVDAREFI